MSNKQIIQPKILKGFRDYLPEVMIPRKNMIHKLEEVFESFGFAPIDTPTLEYTEILMGKGGEESDKQLFRFNDNGGRDVTMRFDLTVPLARFAAQHYNELGMPFKRYHIAPVWRGENTHKGRYREFYQCDFDILGTTSNTSDIEIASMIYSSISTLIKSDNFTIRFNNRMILNGLMEKMSIQDKLTGVLRVIDKIYKEPEEKIVKELEEKVGLEKSQIDKILEFVRLKGSNQEILDSLKNILEGNELALKGVSNLEELINTLVALDIPEKCLTIDLSIARGLDYYTGTIFETMLNDLPSIGSICSGGRYDNLAELYTTQTIPGVGASVGLDRLIAALEELKLLESKVSPADVLVTTMDSKYTMEYIKLASELRKAGVKTEVYTESKKLDKQLKYADRKSF
ncbi:MAG: histidine--tRNA ligase, partial [Candidatus Sericytochromatia bacterium]